MNSHEVAVVEEYISQEYEQYNSEDISEKELGHVVEAIEEYLSYVE